MGVFYHFKMTSDALGKGQNKSSVAKILNAANMSDALQIIRLSSACNIENYDTTITSSIASTSRNEERTFSYSLFIMRLKEQVLPLLIENYGITLVQWKMNDDTKKVEFILQEIVIYANKKREDLLLVILPTDFQPISPQLQLKYTFCPVIK